MECSGVGYIYFGWGGVWSGQWGAVGWSTVVKVKHKGEKSILVICHDLTNVVIFYSYLLGD